MLIGRDKEVKNASLNESLLLACAMDSFNAS